MSIELERSETVRNNGSTKTVRQVNLGNDVTVQVQDASQDTTTSTSGERTTTSVESASTTTTTQNQHESAQVSFTIKVQNKTPVATLP